MSGRNAARRRKGSHRMGGPMPPSGPMLAHTERTKQGAAEMRDLRKGELASDRARRLIDKFTATLDRPTFVYFVRQTGLPGGTWLPAGPVKIGSARNPYARVVELQCGNPETLYVEEAILGTGELEHRLHYRFRPDAGLIGEWFGRGYEDAIVALAAETANQQLAAANDQFGLEYIRDIVPRDTFLGGDADTSGLAAFHGVPR